MPWEFYFDKKIHTLFWKGWGSFTNQDLADCQDYVQSHTDYDATMDQLIDVSDISPLQLTPVGFWRVIRKRKDKSGNRMAIISPNNLGFGLGRMFEMMQEGSPFKVRVFRQRTGALDWLGLSEEKCHRFEKRGNGS